MFQNVSRVWKPLIHREWEASNPYLTFWGSGSRTCRWRLLHANSRNIRDRHLDALDAWAWTGAPGSKFIKISDFYKFHLKFIKIRYSDFEIYKNHYTASGGRASTLIFIKIKNIADFYKRGKKDSCKISRDRELLWSKFIIFFTFGNSELAKGRAPIKQDVLSMRL